MATTAEKFSALINGVVELNYFRRSERKPEVDIDGGVDVSVEDIKNRYLIGASVFEDGREGFRFVDGSKAWRRRTDGFWVSS